MYQLYSADDQEHRKPNHHHRAKCYSHILNKNSFKLINKIINKLNRALIKPGALLIHNTIKPNKLHNTFKKINN